MSKNFDFPIFQIFSILQKFSNWTQKAYRNGHFGDEIVLSTSNNGYKQSLGLFRHINGDLYQFSHFSPFFPKKPVFGKYLENVKRYEKRVYVIF